jgi:hypothetical protein
VLLTQHIRVGWICLQDDESIAVEVHHGEDLPDDAENSVSGPNVLSWVAARCCRHLRAIWVIV